MLIFEVSIEVKDTERQWAAEMNQPGIPASRHSRVSQEATHFRRDFKIIKRDSSPAPVVELIDS